MRRETFHTCTVQNAPFQVAFYVFNMFQVLHIFLEASGGYWSKLIHLFRPCVWECMHTGGPMPCCSTLIYFPTYSWSFWSPLSSPGLNQTSTNSPWMLFWVVHVGLISLAAALWWANWFSRLGPETAKGQRGVASHNVNLMFRRMLWSVCGWGACGSVSDRLFLLSHTFFPLLHPFYPVASPWFWNSFELIRVLPVTHTMVQLLIIFFC